MLRISFFNYDAVLVLLLELFISCQIHKLNVPACVSIGTARDLTILCYPDMACYAVASVQLSVEKTVKLSTRWTRWEPRPNHSTAVQYLSQMIQTLLFPKRTPNAVVKKLSYITVDKHDKNSPPLFGGH